MTPAHISTPNQPGHVSHGHYPALDVEPHGLCRCARPHPLRCTGMFAFAVQCGRCYRPIGATP